MPTWFLSNSFQQGPESTRRYGQAVREFAEAYGLEKSAISEHFIESSRAKLKEMMERRLDKMKLCALLIDATPFAGQQMVVALGISQDGKKTILGIRQGATENATAAISERWVGSGLLVAEKQFRWIQGHKQIPILLRELETLVSSKSQVVKRKKAS